MNVHLFCCRTCNSARVFRRSEPTPPLPFALKRLCGTFSLPFRGRHSSGAAAAPGGPAAWTRRRQGSPGARASSVAQSPHRFQSANWPQTKSTCAVWNHGRHLGKFPLAVRSQIRFHTNLLGSHTRLALCQVIYKHIIICWNCIFRTLRAISNSQFMATGLWCTPRVAVPQDRATANAASLSRVTA